MEGSRCKCSMSISMVGDGCRYCQPQEHIDFMMWTVGDIEVENEKLEEQVDRSKTIIQSLEEEVADLEGEIKFMMSIRDGGT
jgi:archaellum component FlaC